MQTELNLGFKPLTREQIYWIKVNRLKDKTSTKQRATLILQAFIKHDKLKQPIK